MKKLASIFLIVCIHSGSFEAQEIIGTMKPGEQYVYSNFNFDPTFAVTFGYVRCFELKMIERSLCISGDLTFPIFLMDFQHYRISLGTRLPLFNTRRWNIVNRLRILNKGTNNDIYQGNLLSLEEGFLLGYFLDQWYMAGELGYEKFLLIHIRHSSWYRKNVYAGAKDGWYSSTGGKFTFGLQGGYTFNDLIGVVLRLGIYKTEAFNDPVGVPFFANLGIVYHL